MSGDRCDVKRCRHDAALLYLGRRVCDRHWRALADDPRALREALGIDKDKEDSDES